MLFKKENEQIILGNGYYAYNDNSMAIPGQIIVQGDGSSVLKMKQKNRPRVLQKKFSTWT